MTAELSPHGFAPYGILIAIIYSFGLFTLMPLNWVGLPSFHSASLNIHGYMHLTFEKIFSKLYLSSSYLFLLHPTSIIFAPGIPHYTPRFRFIPPGASAGGFRLLKRRRQPFRSQPENSLYAGSTKKLLLKCLIWKGQTSALCRRFAANARTARQAGSLQLV